MRFSVKLTTLAIPLLFACTGSESLVVSGSGDHSVIKGEKVDPWEFIGLTTVALVDGEARQACSGVLVNQTLVLTAAHCFNSNPKSFTVSFGVNITTNKKMSGRASRYIVHPKFNKAMPELGNDLALLRLDAPAPSITKISRLSPSSERIAIGTTIIAAGFGVTKIPTNSSFGNSNAVHNNKRMNRTSLQIQSYFTGTSTKADGSKTSTCEGDSGGPAFIKIDGYLYLWGIASAVTKADYCRGGVIHTELVTFHEWLEEAAASLMR